MASTKLIIKIFKKHMNWKGVNLGFKIKKLKHENNDIASTKLIN